MSVASAIILHDNSINPVDQAYEDISRVGSQTRNVEVDDVNLNVLATAFNGGVELAESTDFMDSDFSLWYEGILCNFTGRVKVSANVCIWSDGGQRTATQVRFLHYGDEIGPISSTGYCRSIGGHNESSHHISHILDVQNGGALLCHSRRQPGSTVSNAVYQPWLGASSLTVQRIK